MYAPAIIRVCLAYIVGLLLLTPQVATRALDTYVVAQYLDYDPNTDRANSSVSLHKRGVLEDLWGGVSDAEKVNTGTAKSWELKKKPDGQRVFAPTTFYGCTLVVAVSSKGVLIGHFAQEKPGTGDCLLDGKASDDIVKKLEDAESLVDIDEGEDKRAWIVYSDDIRTDSVGYKKILENLSDTMDIENITPIPYRRGGGGGNSDKLVVQTGPTDDEGLSIKVYIRSDNPTTLTFDDDGEEED